MVANIGASQGALFDKTISNNNYEFKLITATKTNYRGKDTSIGILIINVDFQENTLLLVHVQMVISF